MALVILSLLLALSAIAIALRFGEHPERQGAKIVCGMVMGSYLGAIFIPNGFRTVDPSAFMVDFIGFIGFALIGIYSTRVWPLWASAFQLLSIGAHIIRALELPVRPIVYAWMKSTPTWAVLLLLIGGTLANRRQQRSSGSGFSPT